MRSDACQDVGEPGAFVEIDGFRPIRSRINSTDRAAIRVLQLGLTKIL
jgi:hypothetical protein